MDISKSSTPETLLSVFAILQLIILQFDSNICKVAVFLILPASSGRNTFPSGTSSQGRQVKLRLLIDSEPATNPRWRLGETTWQFRLRWLEHSYFRIKLRFIPTFELIWSIVAVILKYLQSLFRLILTFFT